MPECMLVVFSDLLSAVEPLQLPTFCSCNDLHDRSATFCISVLQKTQASGGAYCPSRMYLTAFSALLVALTIFEILSNIPQLLLIIRHSLCRQFPHLAVEPEFHDSIIHFHDKENPLFLTVSNQEEGVNAYRT